MFGRNTGCESWGCVHSEMICEPHLLYGTNIYIWVRGGVVVDLLEAL